MTHHKEENKIICHYCDHQSQAPPRCPQCGFEGIRYGGIGTQRLEAEVKSRFPNATCLRMDSDTMRKPGSHQEALAKFRDGDVQILLGTQMIAKGLDFPNVTLVGVINADTGLHLPDFRAAERTFQLVTQVAGRTGRGSQGGRVLVQTFSPDHYAIECASRHDYRRFAELEMEIRSALGYPPLGSMIRLIFRGESESRTNGFASEVVGIMQRFFAEQQAAVRLLGPTPAPIAKLRGRFRFHVFMQAPEKSVLQAAVRRAEQELKPLDDVQWLADVDPLDML
jgi:primosomal protein N' (replication factor Y)